MPSAWACGRCKPAQPWSEQSTLLLKTLVLGKTISFRCHDLDRYDRHICDLALRTTANVQMVLAGVAWANRANPRYLRDSSVAAAADQARINRRGLWSQPGQTAPWEWRKTEWMQPQCPKGGRS